ncbi:545_t:CDS:1, partial [Ambispora leptoticha]
MSSGIKPNTCTANTIILSRRFLCGKPTKPNTMHAIQTVKNVITPTNT